MADALLFERDDVEEVDDWAERIPRLGRSSILWIDLERPEPDEIRRLVDQLDLSEASAQHLVDLEGGPRLVDHERYLHVTANALSDARERELTRVECLVSKHWLVTMRESPLEVLETFRDRAVGSGDTGRLAGPEFLTSLLEWVLAGYLDAFEEIEHELEDVGTRAMLRSRSSCRRVARSDACAVRRSRRLDARHRPCEAMDLTDGLGNTSGDPAAH